MPRPNPTKKPSEYVYSVDEADIPMIGRLMTIALVEKAFFVENGHMDDCHVSEEVDGLPKCIEEEAEGYFTSAEPIGVVCMQIEAAGIRFDADFDAFILFFRRGNLALQGREERRMTPSMH